MPGISSKGLELPSSPIRKLVPFAEAAKKRGTKVFHLNIGQPDIHSPQEVLNAIRGFNMEVIEYSHSAGFESYRRKLAGYYQNLGIEVDHEQVMVTTGGSEALMFAMMCTLNEGDEVIIPEPFYANYISFAKAAGANIVPVTARIEDGFALPPISDFEKLITPKTKAILICNPSNPTGYLYSKEELERLRDIVLKHDLWLFSDEVYREFVYDGHVHTSVMNLEGLDQHAVVVDSVSKRYSLCGVRIGCVVSKNRELMQTLLKLGQARLSPPTLGQIAGEAAMDTPASYFEEVNREYVKRRNFVTEALSKIPGVVCPVPGGAFYATIKLPVQDSDDFCQWLLSDFSYEGSTVMLAPASGFYATPGLGKQEARIAYVLKIEDLQQAVKCLEEALKVYPGRLVAEESTVTNQHSA
ncbi:MAG: pyridoxal phosphate-dependent aminotransferase [Flavobacteriales bacterium]|nr:pyridoxal phosphate-dependent aminotransferase [Flavobacteriales bacterium]